MIERIISGGQTGADRGGLDAAIDSFIDHGGFCPKGRRAEDGLIPAKYKLTGLSTPDYPSRTAANVNAACGTVIFTKGALTGGSRLTWNTALRIDRPVIHIDLNGIFIGDRSSPEAAVENFIRSGGIKVLNVAGQRESKAPGIRYRVYAIMMEALRRVI